MIDYSVPGYYIRDKNGNILHDGDVVRYRWGGGNDGRPYSLYENHILTITQIGQLYLSGVVNIIRAEDVELLAVPRQELKNVNFYTKYKEYHDAL